MNNPKVSIIVPVFNAELTLEHSLNSLLSQDLEQIQIILVDDGSSDRSPEIAKDLSQFDNRIVAVAKKINKGVHEARFSGLKKAKANWIGFMDADDVIEADMFLNLYHHGKQSNADIVICGADRVTTEGYRLGTKIRFHQTQEYTSQIFDKFCSRHFGTGALWNKLYRKELIEKHLTSLPWRQDSNEDTIVNIGCFMDAKKVVTLNKILYHYVENPKSSTQEKSPALALIELIRAYAVATQKYKEYGDMILYSIDKLYHAQMSYPCYYSKNFHSSEIDCNRLQEAFTLLTELNPIGLAAALNQLGRSDHDKPEKSFLEHWDSWKSTTLRLVLEFPKAISRAVNRSI